MLSLAVANQGRILVGLNSGEVQEWDMGCGSDARMFRSRNGVTEGLCDSDALKCCFKDIVTILEEGKFL